MLRLSSDDFPSPTCLAVEWQEAGVILFVDVCRSEFDTASPTVHMLVPPSPPATAAAAQHVNSPQRLPYSSSSSSSSLLSGASVARIPGGPAAVVSTLAISPASVAFSCSSCVVKIVNNVIFLIIGDARASPPTAASAASTSTSANNNNAATSMPRAASRAGPNSSNLFHQPFFGVCASLLPPPMMVQQHGAEAFNAIAFAWLCGPDVQAMRPAPRAGFACCVTHVQDPVRSPSGVLPVASVWVHGGVPLVNGGPPLHIVPVPEDANRNQNSSSTFGSFGGGVSSYLFNNGDSATASCATDAFVVSPESNDRFLKRAVSEDFYSLYELRLSIGEDNVSVWPWQRRPGLPLLCHHSICGTYADPRKSNAAQQAQHQQPGELYQMMAASAAPGSPFVDPTTRRHNAINNNNSGTDENGQVQGNLVITAFGGLRLSLWRSARADLLPPSSATIFTVSNSFFFFDVAADAWEWRDTLSGTEVEAAHAGAVTDGSYIIAGPRPPPVFEHRLVHHTTTTGGHLAVSGYDTVSPEVLQLTHKHLLEERQQQIQRQQRAPHLNNDVVGESSSSIPGAGSSEPLSAAQRGEMFFISGGLRGRFAERSKEMWVFSPQLVHSHIESCQHTGPPCPAPTHLVSLCHQRTPFFFLQQQAGFNKSNNNSNNNNNIKGDDSSEYIGSTPLLWALDLRSRRMWFRRSELLEVGIPWQGPYFMTAADEGAGSGFGADGLAPTLVIIPQGAKPTSARARSSKEFVIAAATAAARSPEHYANPEEGDPLATVNHNPNNNNNVRGGKLDALLVDAFEM